MPTARTASRTAVLVCQGRAAAHERIAVGRFADPTALAMLRRPERIVVERLRAGEQPDDWRDRLDDELVQATAEGMAPRTVAIDEAIVERSAPQVVILGAGLDGRAWRVDALADVDVYEVDHPASHDDKRDRVVSAGLDRVAKSVTRVPVDFSRDALGDGLAATSHRAGEPTTWVWEGVVPYLTRGEVAATAAAVSAVSAPRSRLIVQYQSPSLVASIGRLAIRRVNRLARRPDVWQDEPNRSAWTPTALAELLAAEGFRVVRDGDLLTIAQSLGMAVTHRRSLSAGRVLIADLDG
jgi:methyltransferase (TIGR00027 family)